MRTKKVMDAILTGQESVDCDFQEASRNIEDESQEEAASTKWYQWAFDLKASVEKHIALVKGKGVNAHLSTDFANRLMADLAWLPIWSCVVREKFGYGRIPATSAHVEAEFGKIKNLLLKEATTPMRVDQFVKKHVVHISGITKMVDAAIVEEDDASLDQSNETSLNKTGSNQTTGSE